VSEVGLPYLARPQPGLVRRVLRLWVGATILWLTVVGIGFCLRVTDQVDAQRDIDRDLQMIECETKAVAAADCRVETAVGGYDASWSRVAGFFAAYGVSILCWWALAPPCGCLVLGGVFCWFARLRRAPRSLEGGPLRDRVGSTPPAP
jgi:hypothetical protein